MRCVFDALNGLLITSSSSMIRPTCLNCVHLLSVDCTLLLLLSLFFSCAVQLILLLYQWLALSILSHRRPIFLSRVPTDSSRTAELRRASCERQDDTPHEYGAVLWLSSRASSAQPETFAALSFSRAFCVSERSCMHASGWRIIRPGPTRGLRCALATTSRGRDQTFPPPPRLMGTVVCLPERIFCLMPHAGRTSQAQR